MVVFGLEPDFLIKSASAYCEWPRDLKLVKQVLELFIMIFGTALYYERSKCVYSPHFPSFILPL